LRTRAVGTRTYSSLTSMVNPIRARDEHTEPNEHRHYVKVVRDAEAAFVLSWLATIGLATIGLATIGLATIGLATIGLATIGLAKDLTDRDVKGRRHTPSVPRVPVGRQQRGRKEGVGIGIGIGIGPVERRDAWRGTAATVAIATSAAAARVNVVGLLVPPLAASFFCSAPNTSPIHRTRRYPRPDLDPAHRATRTAAPPSRGRSMTRQGNGATAPNESNNHVGSGSRQEQGRGRVGLPAYSRRRFCCCCCCCFLARSTAACAGLWRPRARSRTRHAQAQKHRRRDATSLRLNDGTRSA
jgi:GLTT repeat (6 copies)